MNLTKTICYLMLTLMLTIAFAFSVNASTCTDSDNGQDIYVAGYVEGNWYSNGDNNIHNDYCYGLEYTYEMSCNTNDQGTMEKFSCGDGYECRENLCIPIDEDTYVTCSDSDGGKDYYTAGSAKGTYLNGIYYPGIDDYCTIEGKLGEFYCKDNNVRDYVYVSYVSPPEGYVCQDGKFVGDDGVTTNVIVEVEETVTSVGTVEEVTTCSDSDGGIDLYDQGVIKGNYGTAGYITNEDYCITYGEYEGQIVEYFCSGNWQQFHLYDCPSGYACSNGECVDEDNMLYEIEETNVIVTTISSSYSNTMVDNRLNDINEFYQKTKGIYEDILDVWEEFEPLVSENDEEEIEEELEKLEEHLEDFGEELEEAEDQIEEYLDEDDDDKAEELAEYYLDVAIDEYTYVDGMYDEFIDAMEAAADSNPQSNVLIATAVPTRVTAIVEECDGCTADNTCLTIGLRLIDDTGVPVYCDLSGGLLEQKEENLACQNDFECKSNSCLSGNCEDLANQLKETKSMMEKISSWFSRLFGED
jgi:tetratricopeptide (TPR) repeat protein